MKNGSVTVSIDDLKARLALLRAARVRLALEANDMTNENKDPLSDHDAIARRAHELFVERGGEHGFHDDDWLRAEAELRTQSVTNVEPGHSVTAEANDKDNPLLTDVGESIPKDVNAESRRE
jgi:hypothetical protein